MALIANGVTVAWLVEVVVDGCAFALGCARHSGFCPACSCGNCFGFGMGLVDTGHSRSKLECRASLAEVAVIAGYRHGLCVQDASEM